MPRYWHGNTFIHPDITWKSPESLDLRPSLRRESSNLTAIGEGTRVDPVVGRAAGTAAFIGEQDVNLELGMEDNFVEVIAKFLIQVPANFNVQFEESLEAFGKRAVAKAQSMIGNYNHEGDWAPLTASTLDHKEGRDTPLLETEYLYNSIRYVVDRASKTVTLGSDADYLVFSELGTSHEPPRPLLAPALTEAAQDLPSDLKGAIDVGFNNSWERMSHSFPRSRSFEGLVSAAISAGRTAPRLPSFKPEVFKAFDFSGDNF